MMNAISENRLINMMTARFRHSPLQLNHLHQSDSEIIRLPGISVPLLAATTDSIVEEIRSGLYTDPYLIGWMTVMANMSDLAATGAEPIGILVSEILPEGYPLEHLQQLQNKGGAS